MSSLICPFCPHDINPEKGFSLGFQVLVICPDCALEAIEGWKRWRWATGDCFRCNAKAVRVFGSFPTKFELAICERCLNAAHTYLSGAEPVPEPTRAPRRLTKSEQTSGNT